MTKAVKASKSCKPRPLFSRAETIGLAKRFVKPEQYDGARDLMVMYQLFKNYPSRDFWQNYFLTNDNGETFLLNAAVWFLGKDGREKLARDWSIFNLHLEAPKEYKLEDEKQGEDFKVEKKIKTVADLLK